MATTIYCIKCPVDMLLTVGYVLSLETGKFPKEIYPLFGDSVSGWWFLADEELDTRAKGRIKKIKGVEGIDELPARKQKPRPLSYLPQIPV